MDDRNFLDQFSNEGYKSESNPNKPKTEDSDNDKEKIDNPLFDHKQDAVANCKDANGKREIKQAVNDQAGKNSFPETKTAKKSYQKIVTTEHIVEKDDHYQKQKMIRYGIIGGSVVAVCLIIFFIFRVLNRIEVKDFVGTSIAEARTWGLASQITIEIDEQFDLKYDENIIIKQSVEPHGKLQRGSVLGLTVSLGPDPDEFIELPNFESMTTTEVVQWRQDLKVFNVSIREEYSEEVEKNHFIRKEFGSNVVTEENYTRKDGLIIYMSKGQEIFESNIEVPNFTDHSKEEVEEWALEHDIELIIEEGTSTTIPVDFIISQNVAAGEKIARKDELTVVVSIGQSVIVPNFNNYTAEEAIEIFSEEFNIIIQRRYHGTVPFGRVISQSESAGTELINGEIMPRVTVVYSLGRPYIDNLIGTSETELAELFYQYTSQGANITYTIIYVDSGEAKGSIVSMSKYAQFLLMTDHVNINVSRGNLAPPVSPAPPPIDHLPDPEAFVPRDGKEKPVNPELK